MCYHFLHFTIFLSNLFTCVSKKHIVDYLGRCEAQSVTYFNIILEIELIGEWLGAFGRWQSRLRAWAIELIVVLFIGRD